MAPEDSNSGGSEGDDEAGVVALDLTDGRSVDWLKRGRERLGIEAEEDFREALKEQRREAEAEGEGEDGGDAQE